MKDWTKSGTSLRSHFKDRLGVSNTNRVSALTDFVLLTEEASGRRMDLSTVKVHGNLSSIYMG